MECVGAGDSPAPLFCWSETSQACEVGDLNRWVSVLTEIAEVTAHPSLVAREFEGGRPARTASAGFHLHPPLARTFLDNHEAALTLVGKTAVVTLPAMFS